MTDISKSSPKNSIKLKRVSPRKGRWSAEEKLKFKEGLTQYGRNWKKIQSHVKSRSLLQIRSHAQKYFVMQHKLQKRNKRWKRNTVKEQLYDNEMERGGLDLGSNESLNQLCFIEKVTDCPNMIQYTSSDVVYSPYSHGSIPVFQYTNSFQPLPYPNPYCNFGLMNPIVQGHPGYGLPMALPMPAMNMALNRNGTFLNYQMQNAGGGGFLY